jgi:hypothetical protein
VAENMTDQAFLNSIASRMGLLPVYRSSGGEAYYTKADALRLVDVYRDAGYAFLGIEGFRYDGRFLVATEMIGDWSQGGIKERWPEFVQLSYRATVRFLKEAPEDAELVFTLVSVTQQELDEIQWHS